METYIILGKYTNVGKTHTKALPERLEKWQIIVEEAGGKWVGYYLTVGQYDMVLILQFPNSKILTTLLMAQGLLGNLDTQTMLAFTQPEIKGMVANLP